jgi:pyruvate/2-oxoglutarate dehydrogenase complex dihydrolipoamide dehydrogenase (E3) component
MATKYDAIVIGTGQAGPSLAVRLAGTGMKVAIIERKRFGGTCVNNGCIPTKTLVASARAAHVARRAGDYGVTIHSSIAVDMKKVKMRKDAVVRQSSEGLQKWLRNTQNLTVIEGHARFADGHRVRVSDELLEADKIFINVGGRASVPPLRGIHEVSYLNNSTMMDVDFLPEHLVVIGGSYVGLEFAQMYRRFGSDPPLGRAGMTEAKVRESGRKALIGKRPMTQVGRAREKGETDGFMKILVDAKTNKILGASLLGIECDEVIHSILDVMYANAPYMVIQRAMHIHPTVTELIPTMLGELKPLD